MSSPFTREQEERLREIVMEQLADDAREIFPHLARVSTETSALAALYEGYRKRVPPYHERKRPAPSPAAQTLEQEILSSLEGLRRDMDEVHAAVVPAKGHSHD